MLDLVKSWITSNPSRNASVIPIEIRLLSDTSEQYQIVNGPGGCIGTPLEPPGPVSFWLWHTDPLYRVGTVKVRTQILREKLIELASQIETRCKGHRWQRKKIQEQLAGQLTAAVSPQQDTHELDEALCFILGFQKLILDDIHKKVLQFPKDFRSWTNEFPVWTTGLGSRCIYHLPGEKSLGSGLRTWVDLQESDGWKIQWPSADGKLEEIKSKCVAKNIRPTVDKPLKDDWSLVLGKSDAKEVLTKQFA